MNRGGMGWTLSADERDVVRLEHDDGYRLVARKGSRGSDAVDWQFEVADTVIDQELLRRLHSVSDEEHLWRLLDDYADRYPP